MTRYSDAEFLEKWIGGNESRRQFIRRTANLSVEWIHGGRLVRVSMLYQADKDKPRLNFESGLRVSFDDAITEAVDYFCGAKENGP
jgi:hypothetical protein